MKRNEAKKLLLEGKKIGEICNLIPGQDCMIYKGKWPDDPEASDEIIETGRENPCALAMG